MHYFIRSWANEMEEQLSIPTGPIVSTAPFKTPALINFLKNGNETTAADPGVCNLTLRWECRSSAINAKL